MCVALCLIVVPLPPGENLFELKINNNKIIIKKEVKMKSADKVALV
jgi:hypothetical protein